MRCVGRRGRLRHHLIDGCDPGRFGLFGLVLRGREARFVGGSLSGRELLACLLLTVELLVEVAGNAVGKSFLV